MIIWNEELYHSWGNSPAMKRAEKLFNKKYYRENKWRWGVGVDKHGSTKVSSGSKSSSDKIIDLGPLKIRKGKKGISADLDVTDVVGRKKVAEPKKKKKKSKPKPKPKPKSKPKTSAPKNSGEIEKEKEKEKTSGGKSGSGKGKKGSSKKKSAKKTTPKTKKTTTKTKQVKDDDMAYTYTIINGKLVKTDKKKVVNEGGNIRRPVKKKKLKKITSRKASVATSKSKKGKKVVDNLLKNRRK